ncbi:ABC transporter permease [Nordella sp. HKS 07]|uniref:ABC transporter permease n=1 Tax=Nordella sp. HKS 07 TaxID=2712222 RepID=UPI0013E14880|nr:ABC transporter permease [Nordella sp. HKS 07]QIG46339.1 ABC transporter permease [Nordella sp. HKS 07]
MAEPLSRMAGIGPRPSLADWRARLLDRAPFLVACLMLAVIVLIYGSYQTGVFTLDELNLDTAAAMTLMLAATGQTIVLLRGGIDLSIGGMISLGTVIAATRFGDDPAQVVLWSLLILALGFAIGALNGLMISALKLQPFLVTLATWSILSGTAMLILPTDGGSVPGWWLGFGYMHFLGLSGPVWMLIALILFWFWFRATRMGITIQATGSNEKSAFLSGVSITRVNIVTYGLSGLFAAGAALYLTTQTGAGSPTIGKDYILPSVAAAVIGGVSLFGGRGHLAGTLIGAFILTLIGNLVFVLKISSYWQPVASGAILLLSVLASSLAEKAARGRGA